MTSPPGSQPPAGSPAEAVPTCYRHPGRETYIRCQRCDRPICPECQIPAAVGFQCPECVKQGSQGVRQARTTFGGAVRAGGGSPVTLAIIGLNVLAFVVQQARPVVELEYSMIGLAGVRGLGVVGIADGELYRLVTAAFLHGGIGHLLVNMVSLYMLGPAIEQWFGRVRFLALYLLSALGGSAVSYLLNEPNTVAVGASGAIFGLFGALVVVSRKLRYDLRPALTLLAINLALPLLLPQIDWRAHLGGLVTGGLVAAGLVYAPRERRDLLHVATMVVVAGLIAVVVVVRTAQLT